MKIIDFLKSVVSRFNFKLNVITWLEIVSALVLCPMALYVSPEWFVEDGAVENLQLVILVLIFFMALRSKYHHELFVFVAMVVVFLLMRETNLFRTWFCERYLEPGEMCRWRNMKYGIIPETGRVLFGLYVLYYFGKNRLDKVILEYVNKAPVYVWDIAILVLSAVLASVAELSCVDNEAMEESCELLCYVAFGNCIYRYKKIDIDAIKQ